VQMPDEYLPPNKILFLQNLPETVTKDQLNGLFSQYPNLHEVRLVPSKKDIAFVEYLDEGSATVAKDALHNYKLDGENKIKVRPSTQSSQPIASIPFPRLPSPGSDIVGFVGVCRSTGSESSTRCPCQCEAISCTLRRFFVWYIMYTCHENRNPRRVTRLGDVPRSQTATCFCRAGSTHPVIYRRIVVFYRKNVLRERKGRQCCFGVNIQYSITTVSTRTSKAWIRFAGAAPRKLCEPQ